MSTLRLWSFTVAYTLLWAAAASGCVVAGRRTLRRFRDARSRPPLEPGEILDTSPPTSSLPRGWPRLPEIDQAPIAAAYRDYAHARRDTGVLLGELLALGGSAALGVTIGDVLDGAWHAYPTGGLLLVAAAGLTIRNRADRTWTHAAGLYERRRRELDSNPADPAPRQRRGRRRR